MNSDVMKGKWAQLKGKVKEEWGDLTDNDVMEVEGQREVLCGKLQEKYGWNKEETEKRMDDWVNRNTRDMA